MKLDRLDKLELIMFLMLIFLIVLGFYTFINIVTINKLIDNPEEINVCELYANASNITLMLPERRYVIGDLNISEQELKTMCLNN